MDVLVVADHEGFLDWMSLALRNAGYRVLEAPDEDEGLWLLRTHGVRLVIVDLASPVAGGSGLIAAIKREQPSVKVLAVTSEPPGVSTTDTQAISAEAVLTSPFSEAEFIASVRRLAPESPPRTTRPR